ncbi:MAG: hypothetical protein AB7V50_08185 [Vampirovibrionia bacterium]
MEKDFALTISNMFKDDSKLNGHFFNSNLDFDKLKSELNKLNIKLLTIDTAPDNLKSDFNILNANYLALRK